MREEIFEVFNDHNGKVGEALRSEVHQKGLYHRAVNVFVVNDQGYIFLQKRSHKKDTSPLYWCCVGEHMKPGESYLEAAKRGVKEELGVSDARIIRIRGSKLIHVEHENGLIDNEFDELYVAFSNGPFKLDQEEVEECMFFTVKEIEEYMKDGSMDFTKFFLAEWPDFKSYYTHFI